MARVVVTDKSRSYGAAHREVGPSAEDHQVTCPELPGGELPPTRQRERAMKGFRSSSGAQRFLAALSGRSPHLLPRRHRLNAPRPPRKDHTLPHLERGSRPSPWTVPLRILTFGDRPGRRPAIRVAPR